MGCELAQRGQKALAVGGIDADGVERTVFDHQRAAVGTQRVFHGKAFHVLPGYEQNLLSADLTKTVLIQLPEKVSGMYVDLEQT